MSLTSLGHQLRDSLTGALPKVHLHMGLTVTGHPEAETFLQATVLAAVAVGAVDRTVLLPSTRIGHVHLLAASEEALERKPRR